METLFFGGGPTISVPKTVQVGLIYKSLSSFICVLSTKGRPLAEQLNTGECQTMSYLFVHLLIMKSSLTKEPLIRKAKGPRPKALSVPGN